MTTPVEDLVRAGAAVGKGLVRDLTEGPWTLWRLRARWPAVRLSSGVRFSGMPSRLVCGEAVTVCGPSVLSVADGGGLTESLLVIGDHTFIGEFANIRCGGAPIRIGRRCLIAQHVSVIGSNHGTRPGASIGGQSWTGTGVSIGDGAWIGAGAILLPGSTIGAGAVVAAGSVIRGDVAAGAVVAGVPAREVRARR